MNSGRLASQVPEIEIEMFEVGLGSSIYVRLRHPDGNVRILADGGIERGLPEDRVLRNLMSVLTKESEERRIELVIGTHYDEDHLRGLIPIVQSDIQISEAWLPQ